MPNDLLSARLGFSPSSVMAVRTRIPYPNVASADRYAAASRQIPFLRELLRRTRTLPGVEEVAIRDTGSIPLDASQRELNLLAGQFFFKRRARDAGRPGAAGRPLDGHAGLFRPAADPVSLAEAEVPQVYLSLYQNFSHHDLGVEMRKPGSSSALRGGWHAAAALWIHA